MRSGPPVATLLTLGRRSGWGCSWGRCRRFDLGGVAGRLGAADAFTTLVGAGLALGGLLTRRGLLRRTTEELATLVETSPLTRLFVCHNHSLMGSGNFHCLFKHFIACMSIVHCASKLRSGIITASPRDTH